MIATRGLERRFGDRLAVEDVTFEVAAGEIFGLLGPNGAGKTTILRMLSGLIAPTRGEAIVAGIALTRRTADALRARIGLLTEAPGLWDRLTVRENLRVHARLQQVADPDGVVEASLRRFDLQSRGDSLSAELSKGLKQRVALARALLHDPPVVLLDEPTSGLDPQSAKTVRDLILELRARGHAVIISTHNLDEAERVADRVGVLRRRFLAVASPEELRRRLFGERVAIRLAGGQASAFAGIPGRHGAQDVQANGDRLSFSVHDSRYAVPPIVADLVAAGAGVFEVAAEQAPLEDVYLTLVRGDERCGS